MLLKREDFLNHGYNEGRPGCLATHSGMTTGPLRSMQVSDGGCDPLAVGGGALALTASRPRRTRRL